MEIGCEDLEIAWDRRHSLDLIAGYRLGEERSPAYARLDLRVEREWFFNGWDAIVYIDFQNVLNRANTLGVAHTQDPAYPESLRPLESVSFLPTFGFSVEF